MFLAILAAFVAAIATFFAGFSLTSAIYDRAKDEWSGRSIDAASIATYILIFNMPAYVAAILGGVPVAFAFAFHGCLILFYALFAGLRIQNYRETFVACLILSFMAALSGVAAFNAAARDKKAAFNEWNRSPNMVFTNEPSVPSMFGRAGWPQYNFF